MFSPNQVCVSDALKGKNSNRQSKERVVDGEGTKREDGGPGVPQLQLARWTRLRVLRA